MSHMVDEESKRSPRPPPYQELTPPYHGGLDYPSPKLPFPPTEPQPSKTLGRVLLCLMVLLIIGAVGLSLALWVLLGSDVPNFEIQQFSVPNFNYTDSTLRASCHTAINAINPNHKLDIAFEQTESSLVYKDTILDTSLIDSFQVERSDEASMDVDFFVPASDEAFYNTTDAPWVKDMLEERRNGSLKFDVRIATSVTFMAGEFWKRHTTVNVVCVELKVDFQGPTGGGTWNGEKKSCMLYH